AGRARSADQTGRSRANDDKVVAPLRLWILPICRMGMLEQNVIIFIGCRRHGASRKLRTRGNGAGAIMADAGAPRQDDSAPPQKPKSVAWFKWLVLGALV